MMDGEVTIFEVKRHPFGIIGIYLSFGFLLALVGVIAIIAPNLLPDMDPTMIRKVSLAVFLVAFVFSAIFVFIAHVVYYGNRWILTSDSLTQIAQNSLFDKQNSQLSLGNLEDISAHQDGILAHIFGFGLLKVETAGEREKFAFPYCPNPNKYAQQILMAREAFEQGNHYVSTSEQPAGVNTNLPQQQ